MKSGTQMAAPSALRIIIAGNGFCGALTTIHLIQNADIPIEIEWFGSCEPFGEGIAYGACDAPHLLNVRADRMGAFPDKPGDFVEWLATPAGLEAARRWLPTGVKLASDDYLPRRLYGDYIKARLKEALQLANTKSISVTQQQIQALKATQTPSLTPQGQSALQIEDSSGLVHEADALIVATGNQMSRFPIKIDEASQPACLDTIWSAPKDHIFPDGIKTLSTQDSIVLLGTGLTMIDAVISLKDKGFKGTVIALSRRGLLPAPHALTASPPTSLPVWFHALEHAPRTALGLMKAVRQTIASEREYGNDWRGVIDALRPITSTLWKHLPPAEKKRFMRHLWTFWNVHRHRMPAHIADMTQNLRSQGQLLVVAGKIFAIESDHEGQVVVRYRRRGTHQNETMKARLVINGTGPDYTITDQTNPLVFSLLQQKLVSNGPLGMGLAVDDHGRASPKGQPPVYALGSLTLGTMLESTAVPDLREHVRRAVDDLLEALTP